MGFEKFEWECIWGEEHPDFPLFECTLRAKVVGGWLVRHVTITEVDTESPRTSTSMTFIKDITHEWNA